MFGGGRVEWTIGCNATMVTTAASVGCSGIGAVGTLAPCALAGVATDCCFDAGLDLTGAINGIMMDDMSLGSFR